VASPPALGSRRPRGRGSMGSVIASVRGLVVRGQARVGSSWWQLLQRSLLLFGSGALARLLGFGFSIVAARALGPAGFGIVALTLTLANLASVTLYNSPAGLSRALVKSSNPHDQEVAVSNYTVVVGALLLASILAAIPLGWLAGLRGWVLAGLIANLLGIAALSFYREIQRGGERFKAVAAYNVTCNLVQLVAVAVFWMFGLAQPALYIIAFGLSSVAAMAIVHLFGTFWVRPSLVHVDREGVVPVLRFVAPMVMQTAFFMIWFNADVVALRVFSNLTTVGTYGATKSLSNAAVMIPSAIATALLPHAARVAATEVRTYFRNLLVPVCAASLVPLAALAVMGPWILSHVFGPGYESAAPALVILSAVMTMYGISLTMEASWIAMDRPNLVLVATAASAAVTVVVLVPLVLYLGMAGAAAALVSGVAVKLAILALASLGKGASRQQPQEAAA